jgi:hypothetical protein
MTKRILYTIVIAVSILLPSFVQSAAYIGNARLIPSTAPTFIYGYTLEYAWPTPELPDIRLPCRAPRCYLGIMVSLISPISPQREVDPTEQVNMIEYTDGELLSAVRERWVTKNGPSGRVVEHHYVGPYFVPYLQSSLGCMSYWPDGRGPRGWLPFINVPQSVCGAFPPPNVTCSSLPSMVFDFGTVPSGATSGLRVAQRQSLSCANATSVTLKLDTDLKLTDMLSATVTVNGEPLDTHGVTLAVGRNTTPLDFVVTTNGNENTGGEYTASSVLIMEYR